VIADALAREADRVANLLDSLTEDEWALPTRCPPMTVKEIAAHAMRGGARIVEMIEAGPVDDEPEKDAVTYFMYDPAAEGPQIVARAQTVAAEYVQPQAVAHAWREGWAAALDRARDVLRRDDPVFRTIFGLMRLTEYLRTRVVEVTVHHMDIRDALVRAPDPDPGALEATADVLRGMLGTDARPLGVPDVRFVLTGTGRAPLDDAERALYGPLADKFPLLA
jgi:uncharacterized protein (TIGR03083 family)